MMEFPSGYDNWFDPPSPRHKDKTIIEDGCCCEECHESYHVIYGDYFKECEYCKENTDNEFIS